jgi:hypothetical protein
MTVIAVMVCPGYPGGVAGRGRHNGTSVCAVGALRDAVHQYRGVPAIVPIRPTHPRIGAQPLLFFSSPILLDSWLYKGYLCPGWDTW